MKNRIAQVISDNGVWYEHYKFTTQAHELQVVYDSFKKHNMRYGDGKAMIYEKDGVFLTDQNFIKVIYPAP